MIDEIKTGNEVEVQKGRRLSDKEYKRFVFNEICQAEDEVSKLMELLDLDLLDYQKNILRDMADKQNAINYLLVGDIVFTSVDTKNILFSIEESMFEIDKTLGVKPLKEDTISNLKKRIKYCKNPMEMKMLQKELNALYKKRRKK